MMKAVSSIELGMDTLTHKPFEELTDDEIQAAECVIVAVDRSIPLARFVGKRLVYASAGDAVRDADRLLEKAVSRYLPNLTPDFTRIRRRAILDAEGRDFR